MLNTQDYTLLKEKGISESMLWSQIDTFKRGIPYINLHAAATPSWGIKIFTEEEQKLLIDLFNEKINTLNVLKFVPASGAASRMFKDMFAFREDLLNNKKNEDVFKKLNDFFDFLPCYAFFDILKEKLIEGFYDYEHLCYNQDFLAVTDVILFEKGLNYAATPKALIAFHAYKDEIRTAIEEHLVEGALYCKNEQKQVYLHFTISPEHKKNVTELLDKVIDKYEQRFDVKFNISFSEQKPSTDTVAVDLDNRPFRDDNGQLLFRPAGHGALIQNLNECTSPMIFIKNIDNIVPDRLKDETVKFKKVIGGLLLKNVSHIQSFLEILESNNLNESDLNHIIRFCEDELFIDVKSLKNLAFDEKVKALYALLNRPVRVCGMVKNEGEPGGGPFLVEHPQTKDISLQIVEASQINFADDKQSSIAKGATHFNPVDLVCWVYDYKGQKFDLTKYVDPETAFISQKSKDGKDLKALELPGLWNGAMAHWITVFVEVPLITFNPVKTIEDLIRKEHIA